MNINECYYDIEKPNINQVFNFGDFNGIGARFYNNQNGHSITQIQMIKH